MAEIVVTDFSASAPESELAATVYFEHLNAFVQVFKNGHVALVSPGGTVTAKFRELEKRDWLRESYIQTLLAAGVTGESLEKALQAVATVDKRLAEESADSLQKEFEQKAQEHLRQWCEKRGLNYDQLSEEEWMQVATEAVQRTREKQRDQRGS